MQVNLSDEIRERKEKILTLKNEIKTLEAAMDVLGAEDSPDDDEGKDDDEDA